MAQALTNQILPRWLLLQAGGSLQHARSLLSLAGSSVTSSSNSGSSSGLVLSPEAGRSISTTRGIYMGRVFVRESLQKQPAQSRLFTRENYKYLESSGWSLAACEQVLRTHQTARGSRGPYRLHIHQQLAANIDAAGSLEQLQVLLTRHAHQMDAYLLARAISRTPEVLLKPDGTPDYQSAALVLEAMGQHLQPKSAGLTGGAICYILASYAKCKSSPPADLMHELLQSLLLNGSEKLHTTTSQQLAQLLLSLSKMVQPQGHWPLMKAVLEHATELLRQQVQPQPPAADSSADGGAADASSSSSSSSRRGSSRQGAGRNAEQQALLRKKIAVAQVNSTALLALLLDRCNTWSPEYLRLLYQWLEEPERLSLLYPNAAVQLWGALKGQWAKFEARTSANADAGAATARAAAAEQGPGLAGGGGEAPGVSTAAAGEGGEAGLSGSVAAREDGDEEEGVGGGALPSTARLSVEEYQQKLHGFYGRDALEVLAQATAPLTTSMTEAHLGQLFNSIGRLRYDNPVLLGALTDAYAALCATKAPTNVTKASAAWAAAQLGCFDPVLILPALLGAVQAPEQQDGFLCARVMIATSQMPQPVLSQMQLLLRQELHRLSDSRGPPPAAAPPLLTTAADPAMAAAGQVPDWVASLADSLAGRVPELRPREIAYVLVCYSQLPGVPLHQGLFRAAAEHIMAHPDTFVARDDVEMVVAAFEKFQFIAGLDAVLALEQHSKRLEAAVERSGRVEGP